MRLPEILKDDRESSRLLFAFALCATLAFSLYPRLVEYEQWAAEPGKYYAQNVPLAGGDSYHWLRLAREYRDGQVDFRGTDVLRRYPDGKDYGGVPAISRLIGQLAPFFGNDVYRAGIFLTLFLSSLFVVPLGFYCLRLGYPTACVLGGLVGSFSPAFFFRSSVRNIDTDGGNLFFVWLISAWMVWISPQASWRRNALWAALCGLSLSAFCWWYDQAGFWLVYGVTFPVYLVASRFERRRLLVLLAVFFVFSSPLNLVSAVANVHALTTQFILTQDAVVSAGAGGSGGTLTFPNAIAEIDELRRLPLGYTLEAIVRPPVVAGIGLAAFVLLAGVRWRRAIPLLPIIALGSLGLVRSFRYTMYLAPLAGIGLGYLLALAIRGMELRFGGRVLDAEA